MDYEHMGLAEVRDTFILLLKEKDMEGLTTLSHHINLKCGLGYNIVEGEKAYTVAFETEYMPAIEWLKGVFDLPLSNMLFAATTSGKISAMSYVIPLYEDTNSRNDDLNHCFRQASYLGHEKIMRHTVAKYSTEISSDTVKTAYQHAISRGHMDIVKWLSVRFYSCVRDFDRKNIFHLIPADNNAVLQIEWLTNKYNITKEEIRSVPVLSNCTKNSKVLEWIVKRFDITAEELKYSLSRIAEYRDKREKALIAGDDNKCDRLFKEYMAVVC